MNSLPEAAASHKASFSGRAKPDPALFADAGASLRAALGRLAQPSSGNEQPCLYIGAGTCGLGAGAGRVLDAIRNLALVRSGEVNVVEVGCIGLCTAEPLLEVAIPGTSRRAWDCVGDAAEAVAIVNAALSGQPTSRPPAWQYRASDAQPWPDIPLFEEHPFFAPQTRWVLANCGIIDPGSIDAYLAGGGYHALARAVREMPSTEVCEIIELSGLRGRGGGGFPTGRKWRIALQQSAADKYMICNADEGDPGAFMDRAVIEGDPHRLIEGLVLASYAIGAGKAIVYIRAEYPLAIQRLQTAIDQAAAYGLIGDNILNSGVNVEVIIKKGAGAFVCGEETALIHSIEGKRGMPRPRPPFPAESGVFGTPSIINNVETLANVPAIVANGWEWFAAAGSQDSKGTKVFALSGKVRRTGLVEIVMGTPLRAIVEQMGGGTPEDRTFKAVQIGGPSGGCIPAQHLDIPIDYESLKTVGAIMGSGGLVVMDDRNCMVDVAKFFMDFIRRESCGKCIPCREGTRRMLEILEGLTTSPKTERNVQALERFKGILTLDSLAEVIRDTSLCGLGQTAPNPVLSTLRWFRDEYEAHIFERRCPAGACTALLNFSINPDQCKGCTLCARKCPADAIVGSSRKTHYVVEDKCIGCGTCVTVCRFNAVTAQ